MPLFSSIQRSLLFVVAAALLPLALLVAAMSLRHREHGIDEARESSLRVMDGYRVFSDRFTGFTRDTLFSIERMLLKSGGSREIARGILRDYLQSSAGFLNLVLTDDNGDITTSALPADFGASARDRLYFANAKEQLRFSVGEIVKSRITDSYTVHFSQPLLDAHGDFKGAVAATVNPDVFQQALDALPLPEGSTVSLADHRGIILRTSPKTPGGMELRHLPGEIMPHLKTGESQGLYVGEVAGAPELVSFLQLRLTPDQAPYAFVVMRTPVSVIHARANALVLQDLAVFWGAFSVSLILAYLLARAFVTNPLASILATARRFAAGDLDARNDVKQGSGELAVLARTYDELAARLKEDASDMKRAEAALREADQRFRAVFEHSFNYIALLWPSGELLEVNGTALEVVGAKGRNLAGRLFWECPWWSFDPQREAEIKDAVARAAKGEFVHFETLQQGRRGPSHVDFSLTPILREDGGVRLLIAEGHDISDRFRMEAELRHMAMHDTLTGLPNRSLIRERLEKCLTRARLKPSHLFAVVYLDLDRFKVVNDSLGHEVGDAVLVQVAERLAAGVRQSETVARFGGDEFVILVEDLGSRREAIQVAKRLLTLVGEPYMAAGHRLGIRASAGVEFTPPSQLTPDLIIRNANLAMHYAKQAGGNRLKAFHPKLLERLHTAMTVEQELDYAIAKGQIELVYQPIVDAAQGGGVRGFEALCRWQHPERGPISPAEFIPIAEATGKIVGLGAYVLDLALSTLAGWRLKGLGRGVFMSVNLSPRQVSRTDIVGLVHDCLSRNGIAPADLHLEITETALTESSFAVRERLRELSDLGVQLAVDDFGTGYSNMAQLTKLPLNDLKIDLSLVSSIENRPEAEAVAKAILAMSDSLGLRVIAEGVETAVERDFLLELGCGFQQGYFHARPLSRKAAEELLTRA